MPGTTRWAVAGTGSIVITFAHLFLAGAGEVTVSSVLGRVRADGVVDEVRRRLLDTYYPARGALDPWDSVPELHLDVRT